MMIGIVGNKKDLPFKVMDAADAKAYAFQGAALYDTVSAKTGDGVSEMI